MTLVRPMRQMLRVSSAGFAGAIESWGVGWGGGRRGPPPTPFHAADPPAPPVRLRPASPTGTTNPSPPPIEPVLAAEQITATTLSTSASGITTSIFTFGRKSIVYSEPR